MERGPAGQEKMKNKGGRQSMKKIILIFALFIAFTAFGQPAFAAYTAFLPNGDTVDYLNAFDIALGGDHAVIEYDFDGSASAVELTPSGVPVFWLYMSPGGFIYCSTDGLNFFPC